jgi:two-component system sensor histidine kinase AlgZ
MHPILASGARLRLYLLSWLPIDLFLIYWPHAAGALSLLESVLFVLPLLILYSFFCLSSWYLCRIMPLSRTSPVKLVGNHFASASAMGAFWVMIAIAWAWVLARVFIGLEARVERFYPLYYIAGLLLYLLAVALHYLISSVETSMQAQTLARESQLKALKMQVNPHFLFNSLNSISALTVADGFRAREMCIKLSDFLRTTLQLGDREVITLREELALCANYLEVERVRFGKRLTVEQSVETECLECEVPSLIIQPLVENAIKHGISGLTEGGIVRIDVRCGNGILRVRVSNPYDPEYQPSKRNGIGLSNISQRLQARYADGGRLEVIKDDPGWYNVEVRLPCKQGLHV